jgi:DNA repair exonuclease SbcCD ATPase subunit
MDQQEEQPQLPHEVSQDPIEIRQDNAITIAEALLVASQAHFSIGKSTIQRWAKVWEMKGIASPVKCILVTTRAGNFYKLDRQDFETWVLEQKENDRSHEIPQDLERPDEVLPDLERPDGASQDFIRPRETSRGTEPASKKITELEMRLKQLEDENTELKEGSAQLKDENLNLKIDLGVRRELIKQAKEEMDRMRSAGENLLRENGALEFQIRQLGPGQPVRSTFNNRAGEQEQNHESFNGDNHANS